MAFDFGIFAGGMAGNLINNAIQYYTQKNQQKQAQANTRKNMQEQAQLEDESWYNRIARSTDALRAAGLSPALATGQTQGAAALTHSESMPQVSAPNGGVDLVNAAMLNNSQVKLNEAAAEKAHAEAREAEERLPNYAKTGEEIESRTRLNKEQVEQVQSMVRKLDAETLFTNREYSRKVDEDELASSLVKDEFKARLEGSSSQYERDFWQSLLDLSESRELTTGALMAMRSWTAYNNEVDEFQKESLARQVQSKLLSLQLDDDDIIYSLAHMPVGDFLKVQAEIGDLVESAKFRKTMRNLGLPAQAEFMSQQAETIKNNDFVGHMKAGEFGQAALTQVPGLLRLTEDAALLYLLRGKGAAGSAAPEVVKDKAKTISKKAAKALSDKAHNWAKKRQEQLNSLR